MGFKTLELTSMSAKDLKNVNLIGKMDPYVIVHLSDDPKNKQKTPVHQDAGTSPSWNYTMRFTIDDVAASQPGKYLVITIKHEQTFGADKDLGEVLVPLKELLDGVVNAKDSSAPLNVTYQVRRVSSGKAQGEFKMTYKVVDNNSMGSYGGKSGDHQYAQTSSGSASSAHGSYPPPGGYGNVYPPPGSGYPPQSHGAYPPPGGYPPPQSHDHQSQKPYPPPQSHDQSEKPYPPPGGYPPPSHDQSHAPYPPPGGYPPPQSHGSGGYPPQSHGTGIPYTAEGYPPQSHGTGVPYGAPGPAHGYPQGYGGYPPPPQAGYGYSAYPPPGGYPAYPPAGYPQGGYTQKPQKPKKGGGGGLGMGLGAGLLGGAVGGLVLGEMMDDAFDVDCDF